MVRPHAYRYDGHRVVFVDWRGGVAVTNDREHAGTLGKSDAPKPEALLNLAAHANARRVLLVGPPPPSSDWLDERPPDGWTAAGHFRELRDPCGRWQVPGTARTVEVRRVASWLGEGDYSALDARDALALVHTLLQNTTQGRVGVNASVAATGQSLWALTVGDGRCDEQLPADVADLVRNTSPQHRQELLGACYDGCDEHLRAPRSRLPELFYFDAQFMYAACCRELGCAPHAVLDIPRVAQSFWDGFPYARARFLVAFTVPDGWTGPGLLPVKHPNGRNWHYPNRPGVEAQGWADSAECALAAQRGWPMRMLAVVKFKNDARPVDKFADRIIRLRELAEAERSNAAHPLAVAAFRSMFIRTIGSWHSRGRDRSYLVPAGVELPADVDHWETRDNGARVFTRRIELTGNAAAFTRPELSSQIWARARVRVARRMLDLDPAQLVGVWGDALYTTVDPGWTATRAGEFRVKGHLAGPMSRPKTLAEVLRLRRQMEGEQ